MCNADEPLLLEANISITVVSKKTLSHSVHSNSRIAATEVVVDMEVALAATLPTVEEEAVVATVEEVEVSFG